MNYKPDENWIKLYQLDFLKQCPKIEKFKGRVYGVRSLKGISENSRK